MRDLDRRQAIATGAAGVAFGVLSPAHADQLEEKVMLTPINPQGAQIPGISQGMAVEGGKLVFLSGHVPLRADGSVAGSDVATQLRQVLENMQATLKAAGGDFSNVARITLYVRDYDVAELAVIREVRDAFINQDKPPASALIGVADLFHPDVRVEADAVAVI